MGRERRHRNRVGGHDAPRLPHQPCVAGVGDRFTGQRDADPFRRGLVPQGPEAAAEQIHDPDAHVVTLLAGGRSTFIANCITGCGIPSLAASAELASRVRTGVPRPNILFSGPPVGSRSTCSGGLPSAAPSALAMTIRWISLVPSKMVYSLASRYHFSTGWSLM